jgi:hypothetical protein
LIPDGPASSLKKIDRYATLIEVLQELSHDEVGLNCSLVLQYLEDRRTGLQPLAESTRRDPERASRGTPVAAMPGDLFPDLGVGNMIARRFSRRHSLRPVRPKNG